MFGVVADDITGSNDIALMFTKGNIACDVFTCESTLHVRDTIQAIIVDSDSRFIDASKAYKRVKQRCEELKSLGATKFYKKTCSVFRGNIGSEFDAMLDALHEDFAIVVLGFPDLGRTTIHSMHYVNNILLEDSPFRDDPINPMLMSDVRSIIRMQSKRKVGAIWHEELDKGYDFLKKRLDELKSIVSYVCFDVRNNEDLDLIANVCKDEHVICGSSAFAYHLALRNASNHLVEKRSIQLKHNDLGILCVCGSLTPQSAAQVDYMKDYTDTRCIPFDPRWLLEEAFAAQKQKQIIEELSVNILQKQNVLLYTVGGHDPLLVKSIQKEALLKGLKQSEFAKLISSYLAVVAMSVIRQTKQHRAIIAGGDTSFSFCSCAHIQDMVIDCEIEPGIPSVIAYNHDTYQLVLKSGSFGSRFFYERCFQYFKSK